MRLFKAIANYLATLRAEAEEAHQPPRFKAPSESGDTGPDSAWIGVDLDGTLACWEPGDYPDHIGAPVAPMMDKVRRLLADGWRVKIVTARAADPGQLVLIQQWLREQGLPPLEITNTKDFKMLRLYDDRCVQVEQNTGRIIAEDLQQEKDQPDK